VDYKGLIEVFIQLSPDVVETFATP